MPKPQIDKEELLTNNRIRILPPPASKPKPNFTTKPKKLENKTYAPKPINLAIPLHQHLADHRKPSLIPLNTKKFTLISANDQFLLISNSSKIALFCWRTNSIEWERKEKARAALFLQTEIWLAKTDGRLLVLDLKSGFIKLDLGRGHVHPIDHLFLTKSGVLSLSKLDGKVNLWPYQIDSTSLPLVSQRINLQKSVVACGDLLWVCLSGFASAYPVNQFALPILHFDLMLRGKSQGAVTSACSFETLTFLGRNDGFISVFNGVNALGVLNGGIHSITSLCSVGFNILWAGTRNGEILVFEISYSPTVNAKLVQQFKAHNVEVSKLVVGGNDVMFSSTKNEIRCWKLNMNDFKLKQLTESVLFVEVITWNVGGSGPQQAHPSWFTSKLKGDIVVVGLQEVLDLENTSQHALKLLSNSDAQTSSAHTKWTSFLEQLMAAHGFVLVQSKVLVGLLCIVFLKRELLPRVSNLESEIVRTGIGGAYGNKGAVLLSFQLDFMNFSFVNVHLAAGHTNFLQRNKDASQILSYKYLQRDVCFFFGDTNYRISAAREQTVELIKTRQFEELVKFDQLKSQVQQLPSFCLSRFQEGVLAFPPTYKYDVYSHTYDTSDKQRVPSWCDRVLFRGRGVTVEEYTDVETISSDHRAVRGVFRVPVMTNEVSEQTK